MKATTQERFLQYATLVALELGNENRSLSTFTGIIGELVACKVMKAKWQPSDGYDAISRQGHRVSIKTRVKRTDRDPSPTMGTFRKNKQKKHAFDIAWYVQLKPNFKLDGIWEAKRHTVAKLQTARKNRGISVRKFTKKENSEQVWPKK